MYNYIEIIGRLFDGIESETIPNGDPNNYTHIIFKTTVLTKQEIEDAHNASPMVNEQKVIVDIENAPTDGVMTWDGTKFVLVPFIKILQVSFGYGAFAKNKWLPQFSHGNRSSNQVPFIVPFDMTVKNISFVVTNNNTDTDIEIWRGVVNDDFNNASKIHTSEVRDARSAVISDVNLALAAGDKVAIYLKDQGGDEKSPHSPVVTLWCEVTDTTTTSFVDNFNNDA